MFVRVRSGDVVGRLRGLYLRGGGKGRNIVLGWFEGVGGGRMVRALVG